MPLKTDLKKALSNNYPILGILIGIALISLSIGPFQNPDTAWEYKAASGVIKWGMPFVEVKGSLINQPPLGFYTEGLFLKIFGLSTGTGAVLITLFGLGCTLLVYEIGKTLYGKQTGLLASALFALTPWQLILSNTFLIDAQCLFFSLSSLYVGIVSFRSNSNKLLALSGLLFAMAFYTKLFAALVLIPLFLFYLQTQQKKLRRLPLKLIVFFLPLLLATIVWYTVDFYMMPSYLPRGLGYMFNHPDFIDFNQAGIVPSYSFVGNFLLNYGLGYFFVATTILSVIVGLAFRKQIRRQIVLFDWIFLISIFFIVGLTMCLGVALNLKVPYTSAIKYVYQALPLFSLVAASLAVKCIFVIKSGQSFSKLKKAVYTMIGISGVVLLGGSIIENMYSAHQLSMTGFIIFRVVPGQLLGYSFDNLFAIPQNSPLIYVQYLGFGLVLSALFYSGRRFIIDSLKTLKQYKKQ
jgi:4-amino-4-deoxy-L-arabinose transferase-like glycosyltransferase